MNSLSEVLEGTTELIADTTTSLYLSAVSVIKTAGRTFFD
jgi:hypothetical protein